MSKYHKAFQGFVKVFTGAKQPGVKGSATTIIGVAPSKNIKNFKNKKKKIIKMTDEYKKKVDTPEAKMKMKEGTSKTLSNISKIYKGEPITKKVKKVEKKAMGGRIGLKKGSFPDHSGDGKITKKDILMAKGVIPKSKNKKSKKKFI